MKKLLLIFNPRSGRGEFSSKLFEVIDRFTKAGFEVTVHPTQAKNDARETILSRAAHFDCLCCCGGDGMISEAIDAMIRLEQPPVFGYIPTGTTNDFAATFKLPKDPVLAADAIISGVPGDIDVGCFDGRHFAYVAAFGLFTDVPYATRQDAKNMLGHAAYLIEGALRLGSIISYACEMDVDGEKISGDFIFGMASNAMSVGGFKMPSETVIQLDDGLFEVLLMKKPKNFSDLQEIASALLSQEIGSGLFLFRQASRLRIQSGEPLHWTLDGEFGGSTTDVIIENKMRACEMMLPRPEITIL